MLNASYHARGARCLLGTAFGIVCLAALANASVQAAPYRPAEDAEVLERLPTANDAAQRELQSLRANLAKNPNNLTLAIDLARRYISGGRDRADPRYYGYAEAALKPWWALETPPPDVLVLRAVTHQFRHSFDLALKDLDAVLARRPDHAQALLSRAFVLQATGRYGDALRSCEALPGNVDALVAATCAGRIASLSGAADLGYALLSRAIADAPMAEVSIRLWALTNLAEIAVRLGRAEQAERHFRDAIALGQRNAYLLGAYADFLLAQGRLAAARDLLRDETQIDCLLLRLAIAEDRLGLGSAGARRAELAARFDASRRRGSQTHQREEARFNLEILDRPRDALRLAEANWAVQKEPEDAALVIAAALAAGEPERARPVAEWVRGFGLEDVAMDALIQRLDREAG